MKKLILAMLLVFGFGTVATAQTIKKKATWNNVEKTEKQAIGEAAVQAERKRVAREQAALEARKRAAAARDRAALANANLSDDERKELKKKHYKNKKKYWKKHKKHKNHGHRVREVARKNK